MYLKIEQQFLSVSQLKVTIELCYLYTITDIEQGRHYTYDSGRNKFQVSEFDSTNEKLPFTFRHLVDTKSKKISSSLEPNKPK